MQFLTDPGNQQVMVSSPMIAPAQVEEVVADEDDFHDPMLRAIQMILKENDTLKCLDSFSLEQRLIDGDLSVYALGSDAFWGALWRNNAVVEE
ncbi:hypothetical protein Nepgr_011636 [Nepenthes gracilis]|uniref:Uncharacterized protein n=1 Tax=Nepenthes gracilis TaxID=150966 RepID=A0AAD3XMI8_NEPGR|nr:hypothetical protein Nepgr_011636 [Nepenthes gracilis]